MSRSKLQVVRDENDQLLFSQVKMADGFWSRFVGLQFRKSLDRDAGILLQPCNSIHTFGMRIPIDVAFLNEDDRVVKIIPAMRPFRVTRIVNDAFGVLETAAGTLEEKNVKEGDLLKFS